MVSLTADSNIWISAFIFRGKPRRIIDMADAGELRLDISQPIIDEVLRVLREKFLWPPESLKEAEAQMNGIANKSVPIRVVDVIKEDPSDDRILECAAAAKSHFIVTGDKHLLRYGQFDEIPILRPADFLDRIQEHTSGS